jgi:hypothetical protein
MGYPRPHEYERLMRMLHIGSASAFQAEGVSSILIIRSTKGEKNG